MKRLFALLPLVVLAGCASAPKGSVMGSECRVMERPPYAVRGSKPYDQDWIDSTVEGGVGACGWQRPAPRPAELDDPKPKPMPVKAKPAPAPKPKAWVRFLRALRHQPPVEAAPVVEPVAEPSPAPRKPVRPIDALLGGK